MLTERQLINSEVKASEDLEGVDFLIRNLYDEIMQKRWHIVRCLRESNIKEANAVEKVVAKIQREFDIIVKSQMGYSKYLKSINVDLKKLQAVTAISADLKKQKSSNGDIVQMIPNS